MIQLPNDPGSAHERALDAVAPDDTVDGSIVELRGRITWLPSPRTIAKECERIQAGWTEKDRESRRASEGARRWELPVAIQPDERVRLSE